MPAPKGTHPPSRGSRKGRPNKITADLKAMILGALSDVGGRRYLAQQARLNPATFLTLIGKILPLQLTGAGGGPLIIEQIVNAGMSAYRKQQEELQARAGKSHEATQEPSPSVH